MKSKLIIPGQIERNLKTALNGIQPRQSLQVPDINGVGLIRKGRDLVVPRGEVEESPVQEEHWEPNAGFREKEFAV